MLKVLLSEMRWPEVAEVLKKTDVIILPVGSTEEHGPHLPLNIDTVIPSYVAEKAALKASEIAGEIAAVVAPPIWYGDTRATELLPGTISLSSETLAQIVKEVCKGFIRHGFKKIILFNGHNGNTGALNVAGRTIKDENPGTVIVLAVWMALARQAILEVRDKDDTGSHAELAETSAALAIESHNVVMEAAVKQNIVFPTKWSSTGMFSPGTVQWFMGKEEWGSDWKGVMGNPLRASKEKGVQMLDAAINNTADLILELKRIPSSYCIVKA